MRKARLSRAQLQGAILKKANMKETCLWGAQMQRADLEQAEMQGASLWGAQMQMTSLWGVQMHGANLRNAQMHWATLWEARMLGADLRRTQMQGASLSEAQLQGADLREAQMQGATLSGTQMQGANVDQMQVQGATLSGVILWGAYCQGPPEEGEVDLPARIEKRQGHDAVLGTVISSGGLELKDVQRIQKQLRECHENLGLSEEEVERMDAILKEHQGSPIRGLPKGCRIFPDSYTERYTKGAAEEIKAEYKKAMKGVKKIPLTRSLKTPYQK